MHLVSQNTDGPAPVSSLAVDMAVYAPDDTLEEKYQTAWLLAFTLRCAHPAMNLAEWQRFLRAEKN